MDGERLEFNRLSCVRAGDLFGGLDVLCSFRSSGHEFLHAVRNGQIFIPTGGIASLDVVAKGKGFSKSLAILEGRHLERVFDHVGCFGD